MKSSKEVMKEIAKLNKEYDIGTTPENLDVTGKIRSCVNHPDPEWPMYSFDRPALAFWNGVAKGLKRQGATTEEIKWWLQSKCPRWLLDNMDMEIEKMGEKIGEEQDLKNIREMLKEGWGTRFGKEQKV